MLHLIPVTTEPHLPPRFDLALDGSGTALESAVILSLFVDARAPQEAVDKGADRRGFWADALHDDGTTGSRLWQLKRQNITAGVLRDARDFTRQALKWLKEDGVARRVETTVERTGTYSVVVTVVIEQAIGGRFERSWRALFSTGEVAA